MITNISLVTLWVTDQEEAKRFYVDVLGFVVATDAMMGPDFRWVTLNHPAQPELEVTLMVPGPPLDEAMAETIRRAHAAGTMNGLGLRVDDCRAEHARLRALGVEFTQEPTERPYGVEALMRDTSGNWLVLVERPG